MAARFFLDRSSARGARATLSVAALRALAARVLRQIPGQHAWNISVVFAGPRTMQGLNAQYRGRNVPTDVLSFTLGENVSSRLPEKQGIEIFLCPRVIRQRAKGWGKTEVQATKMLFVHALLHAMGYDHESDADHARMRRAEIRILGGTLQ